MELEIKRKYKKTDWTIGEMLVNGKKLCDTLEDTVRKIDKNGKGKIPGKTAIPAGRYKVILTMSNRFKRMLPEILDVPHFTAIRIHSGNTVGDTDGCPLVGINDKPGWVSRSVEHEKKLTDLMAVALAKGEDIYITIK